MKLRIVLFVLVISLPCHAEERRAIGVVLSGGGARGFAHIGVLKALDQLHVPVAQISGTSIGSFVGSLYAVGYSANEIEQLTIKIAWDDLFDDRIQKKYVFYPDKSVPPGFVFEFGLSGVKLKLPTGLSGGRKLTNLLAALTAPAASARKFDDLPIPFTTIATDLLTGKKVVLDGSNLSLAESVRASMGVPIFFSPFETQNELLVDGGIVSNIPVDAVKALGADFVIAVDVSTQLLPREKIESFTDVLDQTTSLPVKASSQSELLRANLVLVPEITAGARDFSDPAAIIASGEKEADLHLKDLNALSNRESVPHILKFNDPLKIDSVVIEGDASHKQHFLLRAMDLDHVNSISPLELNERIQRVFGVGSFVSEDLKVTEGSNGKIIHITPHVRGPSFLSFGGRYDDKEELVGIARYSFQHFSRRSSSLIAKAEFGAIFDLEISYMEYALLNTGLFIRGSAFLNDNFEFLFDDQNPVGRYDKKQRGVTLSTGYIFSNVGEVGLAYEIKKASFELDSGTRSIPDTSDTVSLLRLNVGFDTTDRFAFPTSGTSVGLTYENAGRYLGGDGEISFERLYSKVDHYQSVGRRHTISAGLIASTSFDTNPPAYAQFVIGGPSSLTGYARDELRGDRAFIMQAAYRFQLLDFLVFTKRSVYTTLKVTAGDAWQHDVGDFELRFGASAGISVDTIIGPVCLEFAAADGGRRHIYLSAGYDL